MRAKQLDPVVWVMIALVGVAAVIVLIAFASRGCALAMKEGFESAGARHSRYEDAKWATESVELDPGEYAAFVEKAQAIDLGIGVHIGADMEHVEAVLGAPDTTGRAAEGGYEYSYVLFAGADGPSSEQRHKGGFFAVLNSASLVLTAIDGRVTSILFFASPLSGEDAKRWEFLTLDGKPLTQCTKDDLKALLGEPTETRCDLTWRYTAAIPLEAPPDAAQPDGDSASMPIVESSAAGENGVTDSVGVPIKSTPGTPEGIVVNALIDTDAGFLYSLQIRQR